MSQLCWHGGEGTTPRSARYTNLPPETYEFEARASNADGAWGESATLAVFTIPHRFTETGWFIALLAILVLLVGAGVLRWRTRLILARQVELERIVEERTEEARNAARAKGEFLANMSHEIRTPMNAVVGITDILSQMQLPAEAKDHLGTIRSSGDALLAIINDILDYSKIESGKLELERHRFDLIQCVEETLAAIQVTARGKGLRLEDVIDPAVPDFIENDRTRLRQILLNLLSNAVKFTPSGSVRLLISAEDNGQTLHFEVHDSGIGISPEGIGKLFREFSQADSSTTRRFGGTGLGLTISKKLTEAMGGRIWVESEPGQGSRFHFTIRLPEGGCGVHADRGVLGPALLIAREPAGLAGLQCRLRRMGVAECQTADLEQAFTVLGAKRHLAYLFVDSPALAEPALAAALEEYQSAAPTVRRIEVHPACPGSTLPSSGSVIATPFRTSSLEVALGLAAAPAASAASPRPLGEVAPLRLLVAEDNAVNQRVIASLLSRLGYQARMVACGTEVLQAVEETPYDVILMDVHMPEMDGLEATKRLRASETGKPLYILALTASALAEDRAACLEAGMDGFLSKPLRLAELEEALTAAYSGIHSESSPGSEKLPKGSQTSTGEVQRLTPV